MEQDWKKEIEQIIGELNCQKGLKCYKSGFAELCKARDIGLDSFLECLEEAPYSCPFSVHFGRKYYCKCPLRVYIGKKVGERRSGPDQRAGSPSGTT